MLPCANAGSSCVLRACRLTCRATACGRFKENHNAGAAWICGQRLSLGCDVIATRYFFLQNNWRALRAEAFVCDKLRHGCIPGMESNIPVEMQLYANAIFWGFELNRFPCW
jgi:hypothetical protein